MNEKFVDRDVLEELYIGKRMTARAVGDALGITDSCVLRKLDKYGIPKRRKSDDEYLTVYAVWNRHTDVLIGVGTRRELQKLTGLKRSSFYSYVSTARKGIERGKYHIEVIQEDDE